MCGRYELDKPDKIQDRFGTVNDITFAPNDDVRPSQILPVIINNEHKTIALMRWGLIPFWAKDAKIGYKMINARAETVDTLNSYKKPFREQRCLIPASGFYEWKAEGKQKIKYYFHMKDDNLFAFAGIYSVWHSPEGKDIFTFSIITTTANSVVKPIHPDRMPVILKKEDEDTYLNPDMQEPEHVKQFLVPYTDSKMEAYPVSSVIESADNIKPPLNSA